jgi:hypothetical protein
MPAGQINPMPPFPERDVFHLALRGQYDNQETISNFYYQGEKGIGLSNDTDMAGLIAAFSAAEGVLPAYADCCVSTWAGVEILCDILTMPEVVTMIAPIATTIGGQPPPALPSHSAVTVYRQGGIRGKHGRGRISMPAVPIAWVAGSSLSSGGNYQVLAARMFNNLTDATHNWVPGIWAKRKVPNTTPQEYEFGWTDLISTGFRNVLGTCRRRKPGIGK